MGEGLGVSAESGADPAVSAPLARVPGEMETAVRADLEALRVPASVRYMAVSALTLAKAIDSYSATAESAAQLSAIVKANVELRQTMAAVAKAAAEDKVADSAEGDVDALSQPT